MRSFNSLSLSLNADNSASVTILFASSNCCLRLAAASLAFCCLSCSALSLAACASFCLSASTLLASCAALSTDNVASLIFSGAIPNASAKKLNALPTFSITNANPLNNGTATFSNVASIGPNTDENADWTLFNVACPSAVDSSDFFNAKNIPTAAAITATIGLATNNLNAPSTPLIALPAAPAGPGKPANASSNCFDWSVVFSS